MVVSGQVGTAASACFGVVPGTIYQNGCVPHPVLRTAALVNLATLVSAWPGTGKPQAFFVAISGAVKYGEGDRLLKMACMQVETAN